MIVHHIKCWPEYFDRLCNGTKPFEVRRNDRDYQTGDQLIIREWDPLPGTYSGRTLGAVISYVLVGFDGIKKGYAVLGLRNVVRDPH